MNNKIVGKLMAFKKAGDGDQAVDADVMVELVDFRKDGSVEIAINTPLPGTPRIYVAFRLPELLAEAMREHGNEAES